MEWLYDNHPHSKTARWIILLAFFLSISFCQNADADSNFVPGEIIIKLKHSVSPQEGMSVFSGTDQNPLAALLPELKGRDVTCIKKVFMDENPKALSMTIEEDGDASSLSNIFRINLSEDADIDVLVSALENNPNVEYAQLNHYLELCLVPNDPYLGSSGSWGNTFKDMWGFYKIQADKAWDFTTGNSEIVVAVIDSGVDYTHEELRDRVINGYDFSDRDNDSMDEDGHGTHVTGIIAAAGNNGRGIAGMSWNSRILAVKIFPHGTEADGAQAIKYAADHVCGVDVINMSWNVYGTDYSSVLNDAIEYAGAKDIVLVAAAGNANSGNGDVANYTPANHRDVMAVAATDQDDKRCLFSNKGNELAVSAPGGGNGDFYDRYNVLSLRCKNMDAAYDPLAVGGNYARLAGTSMAAPYVSGLAALILSKNPNLSKGEVETIIKFSTDDLGAPGFDEEYGYGRINALAALERTPSPPEEIGEMPGEEPEESEKIEPPEWVKDLRVGDMALDDNGNMYVVYTNQHRVVKYKLAPSGTIKDSTALCSTGVFSGDDDGLYYPMAVAVSPSGDRVYVADTHRNRVLIYDGSLQPLRSIMNRDVYCEEVEHYVNNWSLGFNIINKTYFHRLELLDESYSLPIDVEYIPPYLYVVDMEKHRVLKYDKNGSEAVFAEIKKHIVNHISSIWGDTHNEYWHRTNAVNDVLNDSIWGSVAYPAHFNYEDSVRGDHGGIYYHYVYHRVTTEASGTLNGRFAFPRAIAVDFSGNLYIADTGNNRIQKFAPDGSFVCKFGEGELDSPKGIDVDAYGNTWVADTGNKRIVQFDALGNYMEEYKPFNLRFAGGM